MRNKIARSTMSVCLATMFALGLAGGGPAAAQTDGRNQNSQSAGQSPPSEQYAPPPKGYGEGSASYADRDQQVDRQYADSYSRWAARYCVDQRDHNTAAGAIIGGILGAGVGAAVTHNPATGAAIGGAIGVGTGAVVGANSSAQGCPPGYVVAAGAPPFVYDGPYWAADYGWAPAWYRPWVWVDGRWVYHPYRYWYWGHPRYWRPGWHYRPWHYHYRRW